MSDALSFLPNLGARGDPAGLIPTVDTPVAPTLWLLASVAAYQRFKQPPCWGLLWSSQHLLESGPKPNSTHFPCWVERWNNAQGVSDVCGMEMESCGLSALSCCQLLGGWGREGKRERRGRQRERKGCCCHCPVSTVEWILIPCILSATISWAPALCSRLPDWPAILWSDCHSLSCTQRRKVGFNLFLLAVELLFFPANKSPLNFIWQIKQIKAMLYTYEFIFINQNV